MKKFLILILAVLFLIGCDVEDTVSPVESSPTLLVTHPANWAYIYDENLTISFEVIDTNLDSVIVYLSGKSYDTFYQPPFEIELNKADFNDGLYTTHCKAYDSDGNIEVSDLVNFYWEQESDPDIESEIIVDVVRPVSWELFETNQIEALVNVESSIEIDKVELYIDGNLMSTINTEPYSTSIDVSTPGEHNFYAIVTDSTGYYKRSTLVNFSVKLPDTEVPVGYITHPANWSSHSGNMQVRISATDNEAVNSIEILVDGENFTDITSQPYNLDIDTVQLTNGNHTVLAVIYDSSGNFSYSQLVNFEVNN